MFSESENVWSVLVVYIGGGGFSGNFRKFVG